MESVTESVATSPEIAEKMNALQTGRYCTHRSWGFGRITQVEPAEGRILIDFKTKKNHPMEMAYATESLTLLPENHILVQKAANLEGLRKAAKEDGGAVLRCCVESLGQQATSDNIQATLSPDVITVSEWKKWWDSAKRSVKKTGLIEVPTRKSEPFRILDVPVDEFGAALESFRAAVGAKALLLATNDILKYWNNAANAASIIDEVTSKIDENLTRLPASQLSIALELTILREDLLKQAGKDAEVGAKSLATLIPKDARALCPVLDQLPISKQTKLLKSLQISMPEEWSRLLLQVLPRANGRTTEAIVAAFVEAGRSQDVYTAVDRLIRERNVTSDFLYWLGKNRPEGFEKLLEPRLFLAILAILERDVLSEIKKGTKLYDLMLNDKQLIAELLQGAPMEDVRDVTRAILLSPVFKELDKRSLLGTLIKLFPEVQSMVAGEKSTEETSFIVSWSSLERRKAELEEIVNRKIPENSKEIGIARSYGDLRENHEFKAAKEMQTVLMRRKAELESMLMRAQGTDFAKVDASQVNIGTRVALNEVETGNKITYTILGAWDSDPTGGVISYLTPLAKALLNHKVGDTVEVSTEDSGTKKVTILSIHSHAA